MHVVLLKILLLFAMTAIGVIFGAIPIKVYSMLENGMLGRRSSLLLSLLSCFAGGVFLAVCLLDILPDALESMDKWQNWSYPMVPLFAGIGFFLVYFVEVVSGFVCGHTHEHDERAAKIDPERATRSVQSVDSRADLIDVTSEAEGTEVESLVSSLAFVIALVFHVALEGFAFGVQDSLLDVTTLFIGIIFHKALVSFSVGMRLVRSFPDRPRVVLACVAAIPSTGLVGGTIGIIVQGSDFSELGKEAVTAILMALSLGVFLYITFFEILAPEREKRYSPLLQWLTTVVGFTLIALVLLIGDN